MHIEKNVGTVDRSIRGGLAIAVAVLAVFKARKGWKVVLLAVAGLVGGTAVAGRCPVYSFADFETTPYRTPVLKMGTCAGGGEGCEGCSCGN